MEWLWIILRYLFPHDRVRQGLEAVRRLVGQLALDALSDASLDRFARDPDSRRYLEAHIIAYEDSVRAVIAARACQIAGVALRSSWQEIHLPARAKSFVHVLARLNDLLEMCDDIERLAHLRAAKLKRMRENDPLGLEAHASTDAALRAAAHHEAIGVALILSSTGEAGGGGSPRLRGETEGAAPRAETARAPPVFDVYLRPHRASEAQLLRSRPVVRAPILNPLFTKNFGPRSCVRTKREYKREKNGARTWQR